MDFTVTADARELTDAAREVLAGIGRTDVDPKVGRIEFDPARWNSLSELGLPAIRCPEPLGFELRLLEATLIAEHVGEILLPEPVLEIATLAGILACGDNSSERELLDRIIGREYVAVDLTGAPTDHGQVNARAAFVANAESFAVLTADGLMLFDTPSDADIDAADPTRVIGSVRVSSTEARLVVSLDPSRIRRLQHERTVLIGAELVGSMQACLEQTLEYLRERQQFGKPIGSFQAVKHQCADLFAQIEQARALVRLAAISVDEDAPAAVSHIAGVAGFVPNAAVTVAGQCIHLFGAMGFAWETGIHLHLKRALASRSALGPRRRHQLTVLESMTLNGSSASESSSPKEITS